MSGDDHGRISAFLKSIGLLPGTSIEGWTIAGASLGAGQVSVDVQGPEAPAGPPIRLQVAASSGQPSFSRTRSFALSHDSVPPEQSRGVAALMRAITERVRARDPGGMALPAPPVNGSEPRRGDQAPWAPSPPVGLDAEQFARRYAEGELVVAPLARMVPEAFGRMQAEVLDVAARHPPHVRTDCVGPPYRTHSLYNASGRTDDPEADDRSRGARRLLVPEMPEIRRLAELFAPELRVLALACSPPGTHLRTHRENVAFSPVSGAPRDVYEGKHILLRLHLPVLADDRAYSTIAGQRYRFEPGVLYLYNNSLPHSTDNESDLDRYHVLFDVWLGERLWREVLSPLLDPTAAALPPPPFLRLGA